MKMERTIVSCNVSNCCNWKEGKCSLSKIDICSYGRGDLCCDSSSTLCNSFRSREDSYRYEFAKEYLEKFPNEIHKKEAIIME